MSEREAGEKEARRGPPWAIRAAGRTQEIWSNPSQRANRTPRMPRAEHARQLIRLAIRSRNAIVNVSGSGVKSVQYVIG